MRLVVAVSRSDVAKYETALDEQTAGTWRERIKIEALDVEKSQKDSNNHWVDHWAHEPNLDMVNRPGI